MAGRSAAALRRASVRGAAELGRGPGGHVLRQELHGRADAGEHRPGPGRAGPARLRGLLRDADCGLCVAQAVAELPNYCRFRRGCRVLYSSCMARYETYPFFFPVTGAGAGADADASSSHAGEYETVVLTNHK